MRSCRADKLIDLPDPGELAFDQVNQLLYQEKSGKLCQINEKIQRILV